MHSLKFDRAAGSPFRAYLTKWGQLPICKSASLSAVTLCITFSHSALSGLRDVTLCQSWCFSSQWWITQTSSTDRPTDFSGWVMRGTFTMLTSTKTALKISVRIPNISPPPIIDVSHRGQQVQLMVYLWCLFYLQISSLISVQHLETQSSNMLKSQWSEKEGGV